MIDWMNYAVFFNALNLFSRDLALPDGNGRQFNSWNVVDNLIEKCTIEQLQSTGPLLKCPGHDLLILVQMVTETFSWHCLVIQSCLRSLQPSGKKKKRGSGAADHSHLPLCEAIRRSIDSLCAAVGKVTTWLKEQLNELEDEKLSYLLSFLHRNGCDEGPGHILEILEAEAGTLNPEVGDRISQMLQLWSSADVARKVIKGQCSVLSEFYCLCNSKLKSMRALRQLIQ